MKPVHYPLLFPIALVFYEVATYLANDMYLPSLPTLISDFQSSEGIAQDTLSAWFLGAASMQLLVGPLSDRFGRKRTLLIAGAFFVFSNLLCAVTHQVTTFLIARFIQGSAVCSVVVAGYAAVHEYYYSKVAVKLIAIMGSVTILAPAFGPLLGAIIIELSHWRYIFYLLAFWAFIALSVLFIVMPETNPNRVALQFKGVLTDYISITQNKTFIRYALPFCLVFMSIICWLVESTFLIIETFNYSVTVYGVIQLIVFSGFILGAQITGYLIQKKTIHEVVQLGIRIAFLSILALLGGAILFPRALWLCTFFMTVLTFGCAVISSPLQRGAIEACKEPMGRRMAIFSFYMSIFGVIAVFLVRFFKGDSILKLSLPIAFGVILAFFIFQLQTFKRQ